MTTPRRTDFARAATRFTATAGRQHFAAGMSLSPYASLVNNPA
jgi:hypothetical protein